MTKLRWCMGMAGTPRRQFGNIVGHVKGVDDMGNAWREWTAQTVRSRRSTGATWSGSRSDGAANSS